MRFADHVLVDWAAAGLPRPSLAKGVIETAERSSFGRHAGNALGA